MNQPNLEDIRRARSEILRITDPEDTVTYMLIELVGPCQVANYLTGREELTQRHLYEHLEASGLQQLPAASTLLKTLTERTERWATRRGGITAEQDATLARASGSWLCIPEDADWPQALNDLDARAPVGLWGRGDRSLLAHLSQRSRVAVVGSRDVSAYGNSVTSHLAGELAQRGSVVISGGAFGVDATAHRAALASGSQTLPTIALMAGGLDRLYPKQNENLLTEVMHRGLILSEVPLGQNPTRYRFLQRNRLIAALAQSTIVVEARWRSGALNTAHHALELGRALYAVPGPIFSPTSEGCHRLIRDGLAELVADASQVHQDQPLFNENEQGSLFGQADTQQALLDSLTEVQQRIWDLLPVRQPALPEQLAASSGLPSRTVMLTLSQLERLGLAQGQAGRWIKAPGG